MCCLEACSAIDPALHITALMSKNSANDFSRGLFFPHDDIVYIVRGQQN